VSDNVGADKKTVPLTINGVATEAEEGRMVIDVAEEMGVFVPRFCYHPGMKSVAVCRMCLVQVEGSPKLLPACATPVAEDMKVNTAEEEAVDAQSGMLEFLLINHPLDCPICDRAGECPLQDQTLMHGPGSTRYVEPKRTFEKALEISDLVVLDRERCVLCWRCVRFASEIAGDEFIQLVDRGPGTQILTFKDDPFDSYFSGNTIQICPVGALTSKPYRFLSRPWNLKSSPSVCGYCSVGCPITNESRSEKLVRCQALPNENVNDFWICDKGRFAYHYVDAADRLDSPLIRSEETGFEPTGWGRALDVVTERLKAAKGIGVIAGGHLTTEDAFGISRLAKKTLETADVDSRIQDAGAPYEAFIELEGVAGSTATLNDVENATGIVWVGPDPKETLPVLYLRLRKAVVDLGATLAVVSSHRISLDYFASHLERPAPGTEADAVASLRSAGLDLGDRPVVCWGPSSPGRDESDAARSVIEFAQAIDAKVLVCPPHAGSQGMIDMGVHPAIDAGYVRRDEPGRDTRAILEAAAAGEIDTLLIFGADPMSDFPDADLAREALAGDVFTITVEILATDTVGLSDVVLPSAAYAERDGTFTNLERRLQKLEANVPAPGSATEPWRICASIAEGLGDEWNWLTLSDVWSFINKEVPSHEEIRLPALEQLPPMPRPEYDQGWQGAAAFDEAVVSGPGGQYPKGFRSGFPAQTGHNWPLSWEIREFEARQRPGLIPSLPSSSSNRPGDSTAAVDSGTDDASPGPGSSPSSSNRRDDSTARSDSGDVAEADPGNSSFSLYTGRLIYDEGAMVSRSKALRNLARKPFVEIDQQDALALELEEGDEAVVAVDGKEYPVKVVIGDIARGAVFVPYQQKGLPANELISGVNPVVEVRKP
jgi:NADH-quinone oxidoreductase subunit G